MGSVIQKDLVQHTGHDIVCVSYGKGHNISIECETCNMVLVDVDKCSEFWNLADVKDKMRQDQKYNNFENHLYHRLHCVFRNGMASIICEDCDGMVIFEPQDERDFDNIFIADAAWYAADLRSAFKKFNIPYTKENVQAFLDNDGGQRFAAGVVSAGWEIIRAIVVDFKCEGVFDED